ncbi:MAG: FAD-binding oxidoreductase [Gammaproteobacteria bacterium]|nr:FAD-binding oxidoreductase [Gammaproteobacteria bacterium]
MMKWWGWGDSNFTFPMSDKPRLWPWIASKLGVASTSPTAPPVDLASIRIPASLASTELFAELGRILRPEQIGREPLERLLHSYGKSFPDLFQVRSGILRRAPDAVLLPDSHEQVEALVALASRRGFCLIPFGGGTNIVGAINPLADEARPVLTLSLRMMNRLVAVDAESRTATIQAGALGPKLESDLAAHGQSLGHYPDSFEYSTLGGWLATRSAGMQSDAYGRIEDMIVSMKMVTPAGTIVTKSVPASSAGPDLNRIIVGSEGILGVITEATMRIHRTPAARDYRGYLFRSFADGVHAIQECLDRGCTPSMVRLQDSGESELGFNMKAPPQGLARWLQGGMKSWLRSRGYTEPCILILGFEGERNPIARVRRSVARILKRHGGFALGQGVARTWSKDKFNIPYLRDYVMDYGCMADVAETSTLWSNVLPLYAGTVAAVKARFREEDGTGYIGCHISHTYRTGACLYFTFAARQPRGKELEHYYEYKRLLTDTIMALGGTLSHHHAVGTEHRRWIQQEISPAGLQALCALKSSLDPKHVLNPGKLLPPPQA